VVMMVWSEEDTFFATIPDLLLLLLLLLLFDVMGPPYIPTPIFKTGFAWI